jgi:hypothetical protein
MGQVAAQIAKAVPTPTTRQIDTKLVDLARSLQVLDMLVLLSPIKQEPATIRWTPLCWSRLDTIRPLVPLAAIPCDTF